MVDTKAVTNQTITADLTNKISIPKLDVAPASPIDGQAYYDNVLKKNRQWSAAKSQWVTFGGGDPNPWWLMAKRWNWIDDNIMVVFARAMTNQVVALFGQSIGGVQDVGSTFTVEPANASDIDIGNCRRYNTGTTINSDIGESITATMNTETHPYPLSGMGFKHRLIDALWIYIQFKLGQTADTRFEFFAHNGNDAYLNAGTYPANLAMIGVRFTGTGNWILFSRNEAGAEQTADSGVPGGTTAKQFLLILDANNLKLYQDGSATAIATIASPNYNQQRHPILAGTILRNLAAADKLVRVSEFAMGQRVAV